MSYNLLYLMKNIEDTTVQMTICFGDSIVVGGSVYVASGTYLDTLINIDGCDSAEVNLELTVNPVYDFVTVDTICDGDIYPFQGTDYTVSGLYIINYSTALGCDSTYTLDLFVKPTADSSITDAFCQGDSIRIGTSVYQVTGNYSDTLVAANGCDSVVNLALTVYDLDTNVF